MGTQEVEVAILRRAPVGGPFATVLPMEVAKYAEATSSATSACVGSRWQAKVVPAKTTKVARTIVCPVGALEKLPELARASTLRDVIKLDSNSNARSRHVSVFLIAVS